MNLETPATAHTDAALPGAALTDVAQRMRGHKRRQAFRIVRESVVGLLFYLSGIVVGSLSVIGVPGAWDETGELTTIGVIVVLFVWVLWIAVFVRTRWPWIPIVAGALCGLMGGDVLLLLIGVFHGVVRLPRRPAFVATAVGAGVVLWAVIWACVRHPAHNPFSFLLVPGDEPQLGVDDLTFAPETALAVDLFTIVLGVVSLGIAVGVGYLVRRTRTMKSVEAVAVHQTQRSEALTEELARQSERQMLARELHDTLSHRLSVISLHSGALEVAGGDSERVAESAAALRREAKASLDDLRDLVSGVRDGTTNGARSGTSDISAPALASLRTVPDLIASVRGTGTYVGAVIVLEDIERAPTVLGRAVYRIVQESLTNALKHAPGEPITVDLRVSAHEGAQILVTNPVPPAMGDTGHGGGSATSDHGAMPEARVSAADLAGTGGEMGLLGIKERVRMLNGHEEIGVRGNYFVVDVRLPSFDDRVAPA